jgi:glycosyltransferase involved in cell wall biosynthesis
MNVVHLSDHFGAHLFWGGAEIACAHYITQTRQAGYVINEISADRVVEAGFRLLKEIERIRPDIVHVHNAWSLLDTDLMDQLVSRYACVFGIYDVRSICPTSVKRFADGTPCNSPLGTRCLQRSCAVYTPWRLGEMEPVTSCDLQRLDTRLVPLRRSHITIPSRYMERQFEINGFLPEEMTILRPPIHTPLARTPRCFHHTRPFRLLYAGRMDCDKGLYFLADALLHVADPNWQLDMVGDSRGRGELETYFRARGLGDRVFFHGFVRPGELVGFYDRADCLVVPSLVAESFCQVAAEAMCRGLPVVALASGALREWIRAGETALLVDRPDPRAYAAAVDHLMSDTGLAAQLSANGLDYARQHFAIDTSLERLLHAYHAARQRHLAARPKPPRLAMTSRESSQPPQLLDHATWPSMLVLGKSLSSVMAGCGGLLAQALEHHDQVRVRLDADVATEDLAWLKQTFGENLRVFGREERSFTGFLPDVVLVSADLRDNGRLNAVLEGLPGDTPMLVYETDRPVAADVVIMLGDHMELKHQLLARFPGGGSDVVCDLNRYRGGTASGNGYGSGEAFETRHVGDVRSSPAQVKIWQPTLKRSRWFVVADSPSAPTDRGKLVRKIVLPLQTRYELDLILCVPAVWPEDVGLPVRYLPWDSVRKNGGMCNANVDGIWWLDGAGDLREHGVLAEALVRNHAPTVRRLERSTADFIEAIPRPSSRDTLVVADPTSYAALAERLDGINVRLRQISSAVDTEEYFPYVPAERLAARAELFPRHVVEENWKVLLVVARNRFDRQTCALMRVFARFTKRFPECYLHLHTHPFVGDWDLIAEAKRLGLGSRHLGFSVQGLDRDGGPTGRERVADGDLTDLYNAADLVVSSATGAITGLVLMEAMACATPVVAAENPVTRFVLAENRGLLIPPANNDLPMADDCIPLDENAMLAALTKFCTGELDLTAQVPRACEWVQPFTWRRSADAWAGVLREALAAKPGRDR